MSLEQWIEIGKIVAPLLALLGAWWMWLYDQRKRHDPIKQEIYRQRIAAYRSLLEAMDRIMKSVSVAWTDRHSETHHALLKAYGSFKSCSVKNLVLMHEPVFESIASFSRGIDGVLTVLEPVPLDDELDEESDYEIDDEALMICQCALIKAFHECISEIRRVLDVENADIDLDKW